MTPDEQEFYSIHYLYQGRRVVPLSSGRYAVAERLPRGDLVAIVSTLEEVLDLILAAPVGKPAQPPAPPPSFEELGDLLNLDL